MEIEYEDEYEDIEQQGDIKLKIHGIAESDKDRLINHVTNTKDYNPNKFDIISPEDIMRQIEREEKNNPNPEFTQAIHELEKIKNSPLSKEEYIKAADSYASILAERDEDKKKNYEGKYQINPIKKEKYLELILTNIPVTNAFEESMKTYENSLIKPLEDAFEKAQKDENTVIEMKRNTRVNMRYKGKCRIAVDEGGKVIIIDNKNDVDLLRMKYRKEWIEKRYPADTIGKPIANVLDDDEFE
jgi:hypothetical protein